jgi:hypothetical protein
VYIGHAGLNVMPEHELTAVLGNLDGANFPAQV